MELAQVKIKVLSVLEQVGLALDFPIEIEDDFNLKEFITDSYLFISFIVEVEEAFEISLPDDVLVSTEYFSLISLCNLIIEIKNT